MLWPNLFRHMWSPNCQWLKSKKFHICNRNFSKLRFWPKDEHRAQVPTTTINGLFCSNELSLYSKTLILLLGAFGRKGKLTIMALSIRTVKYRNPRKVTSNRFQQRTFRLFSGHIKSLIHYDTSLRNGMSPNLWPYFHRFLRAKRQKTERLTNPRGSGRRLLNPPHNRTHYLPTP